VLAVLEEEGGGAVTVGVERLEVRGRLF
jgi:hypothetical protein